MPWQEDVDGARTAFKDDFIAEGLTEDEVETILDRVFGDPYKDLSPAEREKAERESKAREDDEAAEKDWLRGNYISPAPDSWWDTDAKDQQKKKPVAKDTHEKDANNMARSIEKQGTLDQNMEHLTIHAKPEGDGWDKDLDSHASKDDGAESDGSTDLVYSVRHVKMNKARNAAAGTGLSELNSEMENWKAPKLQKGDCSPSDQLFIPWKLVIAYPNTYVGKVNSPRAAPFFDVETIHKDRVWDVYYLNPPPELNRKTILFVPTYQFQHLLDFVNATLGNTNLTIPGGGNADKFNLKFSGVGGTPRARYLGRSTSYQTFRAMTADIPYLKPGDALENATGPAADDYREKLDKIHNNVSGNKSKSKSEKARRDRIAMRRRWGKSIKRIQRYLGIRDKINKDSWEEPTLLDPKRDLMACVPPFSPELDVIFVAIDVEAYEMNHNYVTEVGVAVLDTMDIKGQIPGEAGKNWFTTIQAHHIRVAEHAWMINHEHVQGCPENFNFGESVILKQDQIPDVFEKIMTIQFKDGPNKCKPRPVVLVFHDQSADVDYLKKLNIDITKFRHVLEIADTREMHQYMTKSTNPASVRAVLNYCGLDSRDLHNAGNDAVYTLQCVLSLALIRRAASIKRAATNPAKLRTFSDLADDDGWSSEGEAADGGEPGTGKTSHVPW